MKVASKYFTDRLSQGSRDFLMFIINCFWYLVGNKRLKAVPGGTKYCVVTCADGSTLINQYLQDYSVGVDERVGLGEYILELLTRLYACANAKELAKLVRCVIKKTKKDENSQLCKKGLPNEIVAKIILYTVDGGDQQKKLEQLAIKSYNAAMKPRR